MKIFLRLILLSVLGLVLIFVISELYSKYQSHGEIEDTNTFTDTIPKDYLHLLKFPDSCCNESNAGYFAFQKTTVSRYRNPISCFFIDSKYYLQVYRMDNSFNYSLKDAIKDSFSDAHAWTYTPYALDDRTDMEFLYKATKPHKPRNIYFDIYGDNTRVLKKNDTIAYYYTKCVNFSIKFNTEDPMDIYGECKSQSFSEVPLELMFIKKKNALYMLVLSSKNANTDLKEGMLNNMFFK